ncbi:hypothetical protein PV05_07086 [Exophiala xenobiotica]|uniref:Uncharacterized protein n=1 Tax=Exophiala xenobiotica TaxID=348802 RepID=A0A0D2F4A9_9EURO|nr:uncharacterized protein PV05_07086 [Exophiala xenobiotica]KIW54749.1 hypothetical protein PV05_07086 [Exophiala xenobiotica]
MTYKQRNIPISGAEAVSVTSYHNHRDGLSPAAQLLEEAPTLTHLAMESWSSILQAFLHGLAVNGIAFPTVAPVYIPANESSQPRPKRTDTEMTTSTTTSRSSGKSRKFRLKRTTSSTTWLYLIPEIEVLEVFTDNGKDQAIEIDFAAAVANTGDEPGADPIDLTNVVS